MVGYGNPEEVIPQFIQPSDVVFVQAEIATEERNAEKRVEKALKERGSHLRRLTHDATLYRLTDLPYKPNLSDLPDTFTPFKERAERLASIRPPLPSPTASDLPMPQGGDIERIAEHFHDTANFNFVPTLPQLLGEDREGGWRISSDGSSGGVMAFHGGEDAALKR